MPRRIRQESHEKLHRVLTLKELGEAVLPSDFAAPAIHHLVDVGCEGLALPPVPEKWASSPARRASLWRQSHNSISSETFRWTRWLQIEPAAQLTL